MKINKKQQLLTIAEKGEERPHHTNPLGSVLYVYTNPNSDCYDAKFTKQIQKLAPQWLEKTSSKKKQQLLAMAKKGEERPKFRTLLGRALSSYTNMSSGCYDAEFVKQIQKLAPQWFVTRSDIANEKKQQLLTMAKQGRNKPKRNTSLGSTFNSYIYLSSGCYDAEFVKQIKKLAPQWLLTQSEKVNKKKQQLLEMAKRGEERPYWKSSLGMALVVYTNSDSEFSKQIKKLAPQWFLTKSDVANDKKRKLLELATKGEDRPRCKTSLGIALANYSSPSQVSYDAEFAKQIKKIAPQWFKK